MIKLSLTVAVVIFTGALLLYLGVGSGVDLRRAVPFFGGFRPSFYDVAGLAVIIITLWGALRVLRSREDGNTSSGPEDDPVSTDTNPESDDEGFSDFDPSDDDRS